MAMRSSFVVLSDHISFGATTLNGTWTRFESMLACPI
jgi:hypothetical protein